MFIPICCHVGYTHVIFHNIFVTETTNEQAIRWTVICSLWGMIYTGLESIFFKCLYTSISFCVHIYKPEKYQYLDPILVSAWRWEVIVRFLYWWTCWPSLFKLFVHKINDRQDSVTLSTFFLKLHCQD
jgi:hypothetical protein